MARKPCASNPRVMGWINRSKPVMKTFLCRSSKLLGWLVVLMLVAVGILGMSTYSAYAAGKQVPFSAFYTGTISIASDGTPVFNGTGIATHLGEGTNEGHVVFTGSSVSCVGGIP